MCNVEVRGLKYGAQADCSIARGKAYAVMDQIGIKGMAKEGLSGMK